MEKISDEIFNFPCDYPIKIFGKNCDELKPAISAIIEKSSGKISPQQISEKVSGKGNYIAITVRIMATDRVQIDTINAALFACPIVVYVL